MWFFLKKVFNLALRSLTLAVICLTLTTCKKENLCDCFKGTGKETTEERDVNGFKELYIEDKIDVHLTQGNEFKVKVTGGRQVIKLIKTKVENGVLKISDHNTCDFTRSYKRKVTVYVTMPVLRKFEHNGVGDFFMDNRFTCDTLNYYLSNSGDMNMDLDANIVYGGMHGNGDVHMKGLVNENVVFAGGQGYFYGFDAISDKVILTLNTSGRMEVYVNSGEMKIDMYARSTGDIYYKGTPSKIYGSVSGSGKTIDKN